MVISGKGLTQYLAPILQSWTCHCEAISFACLSSPAGGVLTEVSLFSVFLGLYLQIIKS